MGEGEAPSRQVSYKPRKSTLPLKRKSELRAPTTASSMWSHLNEAIPFFLLPWKPVCSRVVGGHVEEKGKATLSSGSTAASLAKVRVGGWGIVTLGLTFYSLKLDCAWDSKWQQDCLILKSDRKRDGSWLRFYRGKNTPRSWFEGTAGLGEGRLEKVVQCNGSTTTFTEIYENIFTHIYICNMDLYLYMCVQI